MSTTPECKGCPSYYECIHDCCGTVTIEGICTCKEDCTDCGRFACKSGAGCLSCKHVAPTLDGRYMCDLNHKAILDDDMMHICAKCAEFTVIVKKYHIEKKCKKYGWIPTASEYELTRCRHWRIRK